MNTYEYVNIIKMKMWNMQLAVVNNLTVNFVN